MHFLTNKKVREKKYKQILKLSQWSRPRPVIFSLCRRPNLYRMQKKLKEVVAAAVT